MNLIERFLNNLSIPRFPSLARQADKLVGQPCYPISLIEVSVLGEFQSIELRSIFRFLKNWILVIKQIIDL